MEQLVAFAQEQFGTVDILVNNAGIQHVAPVETFAEACWDEVLSLNLTAAFLATKAVLPGMRGMVGGGSSTSRLFMALLRARTSAPMSRPNMACWGFTKVVALETANDGITCNAICPGWVLTELVQRQVDARAAASG